MRIERHRPRRSPTRLGAPFKFILLIAAVAALTLAGLSALVILRGGLVTADIGEPASGLNPVERAALSAYLTANRNALNTPAGTDATPIQFAVEPGENANTVAARLAEMGLVRDANLLKRYMRYKGLDDQIEAGNFSLSAAMTVPEVAVALTDAAPDEVSARLWEGWRIEQAADSLAAQPHLNVDREEFLRLTGAGDQRSDSYSFLADLPASASLEGFLYPDTYRFLPGASTAEVLDRILSQFDSQVTTPMRTDAAAQGLTLYQVITLASIVEREAVHDDERPVIASVYLNRLHIGMKLDADPTTQYAIATPDNWWPPLNFDPRTVDDPYNTYLYPGLPPGPIASPGLNSIRAVIYPAATGYFYFRAKCDGSQNHNFSVTYEEHLGYGCP